MKQTEITKEQYEFLKIHYKGFIAYREEDGKYYIKILHPGRTKEIKEYLNIKT